MFIISGRLNEAILTIDSEKVFFSLKKWGFAALNNYSSKDWDMRIAKS